MARFYGTIQGNRGEATRLGHSSLRASVQSYSGDVCAAMYVENEIDMVNIYARHHGVLGGTVSLYCGPVQDLLSKTGRHALVRTIAEQVLADEYKERAHD